MTKKHLTEQRFTDLNLIDSLQQGIADAGFEYCTPIQAKSLPIALSGKDVAGQAQTGTGKTVAFLLACCQQLITHPAPTTRQPSNVRALILAPTRELAIQIYKDAGTLTRHTALKLGLIYGGTGYEEQKQILAQGMDILIGTPGRLIDFHRQHLFDMKLVQVVVLDEADRMFDLGFIKDIRYLLRRMPKPEARLNMLFSATLSFRVMELAYEHMNNPEEIKIDAEIRVADKIGEYAYYPADEEKATLLINLLRRDEPDRVLVFVNTRHAVEQVSRTLSANSISSVALSGDVQQLKRERILDDFKSGKYTVLVATDVAARGLHIPEVSHVFNYDLPHDADDYVHRIGRTARAGHSGEAISFICEKYAYSIIEIESFIGHVITRKTIDSALLTAVETTEKYDRKGRGNHFIKDNATRPTLKEDKVEKLDSDDSCQPEISQPNEPSTAQTITVQAKTNPPARYEKRHAPPMPTDNMTDNSPDHDSTPKAIVQIDKTTPPALAVPTKRFSRRFGEIPLIG